MFPNFNLVLDYYEIELTDVIQSISANIAANNCVNGPSLNQSACATIFRNNPNMPFAIGAPVNDPIGAFIEGSINYAGREVRGLDFTAQYTLDLEEVFGRNLGSIEYKLGGSWLIEQKQFNNAENPDDYVALEGTVDFPRIDLTSSLTYTPNDIWSVNWTMDWMTSQDNASKIRDYAQTGNVDARSWQYLNTGNFARHDLTVKWNARDDLTLRAGVVNLFDAEQPRYFGNELVPSFDAYGRRFFVGLNFRPY
jgi:outer membrane receptor protein involved in Fe transport